MPIDEAAAERARAERARLKAGASTEVLAVPVGEFDPWPDDEWEELWVRLSRRPRWLDEFKGDSLRSLPSFRAELRRRGDERRLRDVLWAEGMRATYAIPELMRRVEEGEFSAERARVLLDGFKWMAERMGGESLVMGGQPTVGLKGGIVLNFESMLPTGDEGVGDGD